MTVRGYCSVCDRLVPLIQGLQKVPGFSAQWWFPVPHNGNDGKPCPGAQRGI